MRAPWRGAAQVVQVALKAAYLNCGQNCAGCERFFIHEKVTPWGTGRHSQRPHPTTRSTPQQLHAASWCWHARRLAPPPTQVYDKFCSQVVSVVQRMRVGPSLTDDTVDCGAICMPGEGLLTRHCALAAAAAAGTRASEHRSVAAGRMRCRRVL